MYTEEKLSLKIRLMIIAASLAILTILSFMHSCSNEMDLQTSYPFEVEVMPVPKSLAEGEQVTIRCLIKPEQKVESTKYYVRYFQYDGTGKLLLQNGQVLKPNDSYALPEAGTEFRLYYVSTSTVSQAFDVWFFDNQGHEQRVSFQFNHKS